MVFANEPPLVMDLKHVFFVLSLLFESKLVSDLILRKKPLRIIKSVNALLANQVDFMGPLDVFSLLVSVREGHQASLVLIGALKKHSVFVSGML